MAVASAALSNGEIRLRLHQVELRIGQLHFLPRDVDLGDAAHLEERIDLVQMFALVLHGFLPHPHQFLRRQHAEVSVAHVQQRLLAHAVAILLRLREFRFPALYRAAGQPEVVDVLAEVQAGVVVGRVRPVSPLYWLSAVAGEVPGSGA